GKSVRPVEGPAQDVEIDEGNLAPCRRGDHTAHGPAQTVVQRGIEAQTPGHGEDGRGAVVVPILGDVKGTGLVSVQVRRELLAEGPAVVVADDAHLVVAEAVGMVLVEKKPRVVEEEPP